MKFQFFQVDSQNPELHSEFLQGCISVVQLWIIITACPHTYWVCINIKAYSQKCHILGFLYYTKAMESYGGHREICPYSTTKSKHSALQTVALQRWQKCYKISPLSRQNFSFLTIHVALVQLHIGVSKNPQHPIGPCLSFPLSKGNETWSETGSLTACLVKSSQGTLLGPWYCHYCF